MGTGTIARLTDRGFGFITREGEDKDLFFHASELNGVEYDALEVGDAVTFELQDGDRGPHATNVQKAGAEAPAKEAA